MTSPIIQRHTLWLALLPALLALGLRLLYLNHITADPLFDVPVVDAATYAEDARYLSQESWAGKPVPFWQPPLYPYTLGVFFHYLGENYLWPRLFQALLGAAISALVLIIGRPLFGTGTALGAALATALYGPLIYFGGELLPTTLATFLFLAGLALLIAPLKHLRDSIFAERTSTHPVRLLAAGLALGLGGLAVANILLFLPPAMVWLWRLDRTWKSPFCLLLGCALAIGPVSARNYLVGGDTVLISHNAGINFYIGNNPDYETTISIRPGRAWERLVETPEREAGIERPAEKSRYFFAKSWDFIKNHPLDYAALTGRKLYQFWHGDEVLRNLDPYYARNYSQVLSLSLWKKYLAFPFGLVAPFALLGLLVYWRNPTGNVPQGRLLLLFTWVYMLSVVLFFVTARYRIPLVPVLLLFAAYGVHQVVGPGYWKKVLVLVLLPLCNLGIGPMNAAGDAYQHYWLGYAYEKKDLQANAARHYRLALDWAPDHEDALLNLAALYTRQGQSADAVQLYRQFLQFHPDEAPVRFLLGNSLLQARRYAEALTAYEELVPLQPNWADLHGRLGYTYLQTNQPERAAAAYRRTLELKPDSTLVRYQLARLYHTLGNQQQAIAQYRQLLEHAPDNSEAHARLANILVEQASAKAGGASLALSPTLTEAETHLHRALALAPDNPYPHWILGMLLARLERYREAIGLFERLLRLAPLDYRAHLFLGHLYQRTGRDTEAKGQFERYSQANRDRQVQQIGAEEIEKQIDQIFGK
ncbi:MAG: tetratricopeptide repeat protein [Candidatus Latescibacteria bacterium]|nr:tetratricopeptide repeat protein [Candidatus Latescibacterota bacterium]